MNLRSLLFCVSCVTPQKETGPNQNEHLVSHQTRNTDSLRFRRARFGHVDEMEQGRKTDDDEDEMDERGHFSPRFSWQSMQMNPNFGAPGTTCFFFAPRYILVPQDLQDHE